MKINDFKASARTWATWAPLAAALLAPVSTIYDVPSTSQRWYTYNGESLPDPTASLILSGFSLAFSILANTALVFRFSVRVAKSWRWATRISLVGWILKTLLGVTNLIVFGALKRNGPGYEYNQGFWCAILSVVISGIISLLLIAHYTLSFNDKPNAEMRFQGRAIITSELILFALIAIMALIFSQIENWTYVDGIYYSVVTILSIGFGDFYPTHTSTKILLFPFFLAGISLLANQISIIINATSQRSQVRKEAFRAKFEKQVAEREREKGGKIEELSEIDALHQEVKRLRKQNEAEEDGTELVELFYSACTLITFWMLGALIYHFMEGWTYGDSLYFNYVFLFTIGYGDFAPISPVGRVVFIVWALFSVPIMTQFVVQTIQTITGHAARVIGSATSTRRLERERIRGEYFAPHGSYLQEAMAVFDDSTLDTSSSKEDSEVKGTIAEMDAKNEEDAVAGQEEIEEETSSGETITVSKKLLLDMLSNAAYLEAQARKLIIDNMDKGSYARLLLSADRNLQHYTLYRLGATQWIGRMEEYEKNIVERGSDSDLERVREYRKTFAKLLVIGSKLAQVEGDDLLTLQRKSPFHLQGQDGSSGSTTLH